jgi:hypothetical protein
MPRACATRLDGAPSCSNGGRFVRIGGLDRTRRTPASGEAGKRLPDNARNRTARLAAHEPCGADTSGSGALARV